MALRELTDSGELPLGVHPASMKEALARFGIGHAQRIAVGERLERIYQLAASTGHLARFVVYGSFVTDKSQPNDVDVFLVMDDDFDGDQLEAEAALLFDHAAADAHFGASVFWVRRTTAFGGEQAMVEYWQGNAVAANVGLSKSSRTPMLTNDQELEATLDRIRHFQAQIRHLRETETNPTNFRLSSSGFLAEIDRMQLEVREYLSMLPSQFKETA